MGMKLDQLIRELKVIYEIYGDIEVEKGCHETYGSIQQEVESVEIEISHNPLKRIVLL